MASIYAPINETRTGAEILAGYKARFAKPVPIVRPKPVAVVPKMVRSTKEQEKQFMELAHELLNFERLGITTLPRVLAAIVTASETPSYEIKSARRVKHIMQARLAYYWVARKCTNASLPSIGRIVGGRDHTTVLNGVNSAAKALANPEDRISKIINTAMALLEGSK